ncbi:hypothetical protein G6514_004066, partial [Epicoccum nigrum]
MPGSELRLLALDGGGVRGLSALMILEQLMEAVDPDAPPKPCEYFDMIGGTSTGGLIAVMLGRLRMSVPDCIAAYLKLSERVFRKTRHRVTVKGQIQGRFDSEELVRAIGEVVKQQGLPEDALLKDEPNAACKVFVCATSTETSETVCLTSYRTPRGNSDLLNSVTIWEACRATSAASSFFDPIAVGRFGEEFVDGATGANNPVREVWDQAQAVWGAEQPLEGQVKCLVSIGTGVPSLKPFKDDVLHIGATLVAIATETEMTAERFQRERPLLDSTGRYYRFNVDRGLEDIGLEEAKKVREMAAATRRYIGRQAVHAQMQACAGSIASRAYYGEYQVDFSLQGVPRVRQFVDRPAEMEKLEQALLPSHKTNGRQKIHVMHGLGGMGKTQLVVEFVRRHHQRFSAVLWLDGRSEDSLKRSIAGCAGRIPSGQIPEASRGYVTDSGVDVNTVVKDVMGWLARPDNGAWLLIFDNVDREHSRQGGDPEAYDVKRYLSGADHGSVLITTRLAKLGQLDETPQRLGKVDDEQAQAILEAWYKKPYDTAQGDRLLQLLDGLPLAIAQAGAYLEESGVGLETYLRFYEQQWGELMKAEDMTGAPLQDYPDRSVWTTWAISYQAICNKHEHTANLLLLWSFLDNKDLWHGLFAAACRTSKLAFTMLSEWIGDIATSDIKFSNAMALLCNYSLVEQVQETMSYATHPVVHQWTHHYQFNRSALKLSQLAVITVGRALPHEFDPEYWVMQRRLSHHARACCRYLPRNEMGRDTWGDSKYKLDFNRCENQEELLDATHRLGALYQRQGQPVEAEQIYRWVLHRYEEVCGPKHRSTLSTANNLGTLYKDQDKLVEAEQIYKRALEGFKEVLGPNHTSILGTVNNLGRVYQGQGKLAEAQEMLQRALRGYEEVLGPGHMLTLATVNNLGLLYTDQGKLEEAQKMYERALQGLEEALGPKQASTLATVNNLGLLYTDQGKLEEAQKMYERALQGLEESLGPKHTSTLMTVGNLGNLYKRQGKLAEAEQTLKRALHGFEEVLGPNHTSTLQMVGELGLLYADQGKLSEAQEMYERALRGSEEALGPGHMLTLATVGNMGILYKRQGKLAEAEQTLKRALHGFEEVLGPNHTSTLQMVGELGLLYADQGKLSEAQEMYERALRGSEEALGPGHMLTLATVDQGKLSEAQEMYERALRGSEEALGHKDVQRYMPALNTMNNLADLYRKQGKHAKAQEMYLRALPGLQSILGESSE